MTREQIFGRLIAIATVLGDRVLPKGAPSIASQFLDKVGRAPLTSFAQAHTRLMQYSHKLGTTELVLLDMFGELMAELDPDDESLNKPLSGDYLLSYYQEKASMSDLVGVQEAAKMWNLSAGYIKNLCAQGKLKARKVGNTWILDKNQDRPT